ncbi:hypothetical protein [Halochromatium roseum]|uniref:hypothetical protein n=1 Tax=Halochromatium roseum TaxID=391920 RepID=UPI0019135B56|nr:hypothetical protein [Halochromatium roseum]MBK5941930.1 hypothetical protein [Halochromatium roseum]
MDRRRIPLSAEQHQRLGEDAQDRGVSFASLLHSLIDEPHEQQEQPPSADPLIALIGIGEGTGKAIGRHHNRHLYER